jgi:excisionase family DNA binding protein
MNNEISDDTAKQAKLCYTDQTSGSPQVSFFDNLIRENEWLTTEQASLVLSISANALRIMVHRGQIEAYKFGRRLRFKRHDCLALIQKKGA